MNNKTVETAKEALLRYTKVLEEIIDDNPEDREEIGYFFSS